MVNEYKALDFDLIKAQVAQYCAFSLSYEAVMNSEVIYDELLLKRELNRGREALKAVNAGSSLPNEGASDLSALIGYVAKGRIASAGELNKINRLMHLFQQQKRYIKSLEFKISEIEDLVFTYGDYAKLSLNIEKIIGDNDEILDSASGKLGQIRKQIKSDEAQIIKKTGEIMSRYADSLMDNITAQRNGRTCVLVKNSDKHKIRGFIHDESASGQAVYIEPEVLLNLNNHLASLKAAQHEEEQRLLKEICDELIPYCDGLEADLKTLTLLDTYFAKAKWAKANEGVYAQLNDDDHLLFKKARHPLIEQDKVVANDIELAKPYRHLLISGSNTGGKTVTLKTIGLFTVLTMSGFPLTCEEATIPLFDAIYVDVGDNQSIVESLSTFSAHLAKLHLILEEADANSLVLLDELGSGTDPREGECLAIAILEYLRDEKIMSVATTHYSDVKSFAQTQEDFLLAGMAFDMQKMLPTYHYISDFSGNSNALEIAERYDIKKSVIERAKVLREESLTSAEKLQAYLEERQAAMLKQQATLDIQVADLAKQAQALAVAQTKLHKQEKSILTAAHLKADKMLSDKREQAEALIDDLKSRQSIKPHEVDAIMKDLQPDEVKPVSVEKKNQKIQVGDYVSIDGLKYHGEVVSIKGKKAAVNCNGMKMNVELDRLTLTKRPNYKPQVAISTKSFSKQRVECNIIGMHVEEGLQEVDKFIDDAVYHRSGSVRIVHGAGTGALRKAVHEYLKHNSHVKEFRLGGEGEGGLGATVVTLKGKNG